MNWKVRFKNKLFWTAIIPAVLLLVQHVLAIFGVEYDFSVIQQQLLDVVESVFVILVILGIVTDHTTAGIHDSARAMTYTTPYKQDDNVA